MTAAPKLAPPLTDASALSPAEEAERAELREDLRERHSFDHVARGWYGGIGALILTGLFGRCVYEASATWLLVGFGAAAGFAWGFAVNHLIRALQVGRVEAVKLSRLQALDARAPKPPELF